MQYNVCTICGVSYGHLGGATNMLQLLADHENKRHSGQKRIWITITGEGVTVEDLRAADAYGKVNFPIVTPR